MIQGYVYSSLLMASLIKTEIHKIKLVTFSLVAYRRRSSEKILETRIATRIILCLLEPSGMS